MSTSISLIIVNYNGERYLAEAIASVLCQTKQDFELLIWDDGSSDRSLEIARSYAERDSRVRVIAAKHRGLAKSRKKAIAQTTGKYIGWVDSDDWIANTAVEEVSQILDEDSSVGLVYTDYYDTNSQGKIIGIGKRCNIPYSPQRLLVDFMTFQFRLIRREVYERIGGINSNCQYAYDYDLCLRLSEVTKIEKIRKPFYYYRHHQLNMSRSHRQEQIQSSQQAVEMALKRRGLSDSYILEVKGDRFSLKPKPQNNRAKPAFLPKIFQKTKALLAVLPFTFVFGSLPVMAQQIVPNDDGTMTVITKDGNSFNIDGGKLSQDGKNLFHSFQEFGLDAGQIANFLSNPNIQNILGRINGGNPSTINGLLQVTGGNSNLYLMNPAGIVFGDNASLNVPGDFAATTATSIGIGDGFFNAVGSNDYLNLVGNPNSFDFSNTDGGTIINAGNLEIAEGHNISLTAGTVINTGTIQAPGGNITVAAIPGTNRVRISQSGQILNLEIEIPTDESGEQLPVKVTDLPNLLRGLPVDVETGVEVAADDSVTLTDSATAVESGDITAKEIKGENINLAADNNISLIESEITATGDLNIQANNTISIQDSEENAFLAAAGGDLTLQGNEKISIFALNNPDSNIVSGGDLKLRSQSTVDGDARYTAGGDFRIERLDGTAGNLFSPFDPVIRANGDVFLADYTGASLHILAGGEVSTGNIIIDSPDTVDSITETVTLSDGTTQVNIDGSSQPTLDIRAGIDWSQAGGLPGNTIDGDVSTSSPLNNDTTSANITTGTITFNAPDGTLLLTNQYFPNIALSGGNITVDSLDGRNVSNPFTGNTTSIFIDSRNNISFTNSSDSISIFNIPDAGNAGSVFLKADGDINLPGDIVLSNGDDFDAGSATLDAGGTINIADIDSLSSGDGNANGGNINLTAGSNLNTGNLTASGDNSGSININSNGDVITEDLRTSSSFTTNNINITANGNLNITGDVSTQNFGSGDRGNIFLEANNISIEGTQFFVGDATLTGDEIDLPATVDSVSGVNQSITLQPRTPERNIIINATEENPDSLDITIDDLAAIETENSFNSITFGRTDGSGTITVADTLDFGSSLTLQSPEPGGVINVNGNIDITGFPLELNAGGNINVTGNITSRDLEILGANITTGDITLTNTSTNPGLDIRATEGFITTGSISNTGSSAGNTFNNSKPIRINAPGDITTGDITAQGTGDANGGTIDINSTTGAITTGAIASNSQGNGIGNRVRLDAPGNIETGSIEGKYLEINRINSNPGDLTIAGNIDTQENSSNGTAVDITGTNVTTADIDARSQNTNPGNNESGDPGGSVELTATSGSIVTGNINAQGIDGGDTFTNGFDAGNGGDGGEVQINASESVTTQNINSSAGAGGRDYSPYDPNYISSQAGGSGVNGNITITGNEINLDTTSSLTGGDLTLQPFDPSRNIAIASDIIDADTLEISSDEFNTISTNSIIVGRDDSTGTIAVDNDAIFDGNLTLQSPGTNGTVEINADLNSRDLTVNAGNDITGNGNLTSSNELTLNANNRIELGNINSNDSASISSSNIVLGDINLENTNSSSTGVQITATDGTVETGSITTTGRSGSISLIDLDGGGYGAVPSDADDGSEITLNASQSITTGDVRSQGGAGIDGGTSYLGYTNYSGGNGGNGGQITITSISGQISTGSVVSSGGAAGTGVSGSSDGNAGTSNNISLVAPNGIATTFIDGAVLTIDSNGTDDSTSGLFTATGTNTDSDTGVTYSLRGDSVNIEHGGGNTNPPTDFIVEDATVNGTAGDIVTGSETISERTFSNSFTSDGGTISLTTTDIPLIVAEDSSTGSTVTRLADNSGYDITDGTTSSDGQNLFHSFIRFDLPDSQVANFIISNDSTVSNILARVSGGDASEIDGRIQVSGGGNPNLNLFLLNPAGIVFGNNASFSVPVDFTASTGNGIGIGDDWFSASGAFSPIDGNPETIALTMENPGAIVNNANLTDSFGALNLVGGTVFSQGDIDVNGVKVFGINEGESIVNLNDNSVTSSVGNSNLPNSFDGNIASINELDNSISPTIDDVGVQIANQINSNEIDIVITGIASDLDGVSIDSPSVLNSGGGNIIITGTSNNDDAIEINNAQINSPSGGNIAFNATGGNGIRIIDSQLDATTNITLTGDEIDFNTSPGSVTGTNIVLQKQSSGQNVVVNATEDNPDSLDLTATDLDALSDGFSSITIGQTTEDITSTLTVNPGDAVFLDPVTFQAGNIVVNGNIEVRDNASVNLNSISVDTTTLNGNITTQGQPIIINNNVVVAGDSTLDTTDEGFDGANINIDGTINAGDSSTGNLTLTSGVGDIEVTGAIGGNPPTSGEVVGDLTANSNGNINFGGNINVDSLTTNGTGNTFLNGNVTTVGDQTYNTSLSLNQNGDTTLQGNDLNFNAPIELGTGDKVVNIIAQNRVDPVDSSTDDGNVNFSHEADINFDGVGNSALNIEAEHNLNFGEDNDDDNSTNRIEIADSDSSTPDSLNVTLIAEDGVDSGLPLADGINFLENISIVTGGGDINLTSITDDISALFMGEGDLLDSQGGNITLTGTSNEDRGIGIFSGQINSGGGDITLTGISNEGSGIRIGSPTSNDIPLLDSAGGNINLIGTSNDSLGIAIEGGDVLDGEDPNITNINTGTGNLTLTADEIDLTPSSSTNGGVALNGMGNLLIQPNTPELNIAIANVENPNSLDITNDDIAAIQGDFNSITFGRDDSSGTITVADNVSFSNSNLILQSPAAGGAIAVNGNLDSNGLVLDADNNIDVTGEINSSGDVAITSASGTIDTSNITANSIDDTANIDITADNNIATGYLSSSHDITVDANGSDDLGVGLVTATGTIPTTNTTIRGNNVAIEHGGGNRDPRVNFNVGDATENGTTGDIETSESVNSANPLNPFVNSFTSNNSTIAIRTRDTDAPPIEVPVVAEENSTNTVVTPQADNRTFDITGGETSSDSQNLFHSFTRFDLTRSNQTANFVIDNSGLNNILARVSSGNTSEIEGAITITGGNPNLFLMNPAGFIFSSTATLNVPGDLTVTTGNGIGFGNGWFSASGDVTPLNGNPETVALTVSEPRGIENNLDINLSNANSSLNIIGGSIFNLGDISADNLTVIGLDRGENVVNLADNSITNSANISNLPNSFDENLLDSIASESTISSWVVFSPSNIDLTGNLTIIGSSNNSDRSGVGIFDTSINVTNGNISITGTDNNSFGVGIIDTNISSIIGDISITGTSAAVEGINIEGSTVSSRNLALTADEIELDSATNLTGNNITLQPETPELDIAIASNNPDTANRLDLTNEELATIGSDINSLTIGRENSSGTITSENPLNFNQNTTIRSPEADGAISINNDINSVDLFLSAGSDINVNADINSSGSVDINSTTGSVATGSIDTIGENGSVFTPQEFDPSRGSNGGDVNITAENNITTNNINTQGGEGGEGGEGDDGNLFDLATDGGDGGQITLESISGQITTGSLVSSGGLGGTAITDDNDGDAGTSGNISLSAADNITTDFIDGGDITIDSNGTDNNALGLFTATGTIPESNISVRGENVTIEHGGGNQDPRIEFTVGDATINGTTGDIVTSENINTVNSFPNTEISPNETIQILTTDAPPPPDVELPIVPEENSTNTVVTAQTNNTTFDITGGETSSDSQNLFHSFTRFDLPEVNQTANFVIDNSGLSNILARVSSGDASEIEGTVQVTGGNPNLFLINPAGIIFGENASLNVPADFTVTTANGVGFGNQWFSASGEIVPLNGNPETLAFTQDAAGRVIDLENNTLNNTEGENLPNNFDAELNPDNAIEAGAVAFEGDINTNGKNLTIAAENNVNLTAIDSASEIDDISAGDITIFSIDGEINASSPLGIYSYATTADGGNITLYAEEDINLIGLVSGASEGNGGDINITSNAGAIDLTQNITVNQLDADGDVIENNLDLGIIVSGAAQEAGDINIKASGDITTGYIYSGSFGDPESDLDASFQGGTISLESTEGEINTSQGVQRDYVNNLLSIANSSIASGLDTSELRENASNIAERLLLDLPEEVRNNEDVSFVNVILPGISSFSFSDSGAVNLTTLAEGENITVSTINAESVDGDPGDVSVTTKGFFRATDTFVSLASEVYPELEEEASISSFAPPTIDGEIPILRGGEVSIVHGGDGETPFVIGDAAINGTEGNIYSNTFPFETDDSFLFTEIQDRISIVSVNPPNIDPPVIEFTDPEEPEAKATTTTTNPTATTPTLSIASIPEAKTTLMKIGEQANRNPALVYVNFAPEQLNPNAQDSFLNSESCRTAEYQASLGIQETDTAPTLCIASQPSDRLEILVITSTGEPIYIPVDVTREEVEKEAKKLYRQVSRPSGRYYKAPAKKLYNWLVGTIEADLKEREIDNILFIMPPKLRSLPVAALYDEENDLFLAQKDLNVGFAPSLNLMNTKYRNIQESPVLAFGASDFEAEEQQEALPAVEIELPAIAQLRGGTSILNENFTFDNLKTNLDNNRPAIVHLSTHADFNPEDVDDIYIQLYDRKLTLGELRGLKLNDPVVDLLVISACRSAFGDTEAELGFGGLAVKAGVKTAIGSLWYVGDTSTSALMSEFYHQLKTAPTKAEALRKAQQAVLEQQVKNNAETITTTWGNIPLPENLQSEDNENIDWSHPYFWAPFTMIGSPW